MRGEKRSQRWSTEKYCCLPYHVQQLAWLLRSFSDSGYIKQLEKLLQRQGLHDIIRVSCRLIQTFIVRLCRPCSVNRFPAEEFHSLLFWCPSENTVWETGQTTQSSSFWERCSIWQCIKSFCLKEPPSQDASRPKNADTVRTFPSAGCACLFCQYFCNGNFFFASILSFAGRSRVDSLFTDEESRMVGSWRRRDLRYTCRPRHEVTDTYGLPDTK